LGTKYRFRTKPYQHQWKAIKRLVKSDFGLALLMDPRTGKTKTIIDYMGIMHLKHGLSRVVVICPSRVIGVWLEEIHTHSPFMIETLVWDRDGRKKMPRLPRDTRYDMQVLIVNYEAFAIPGKKLSSGRRSKSSGRFKFKSEIARWIGDDDALGVLDESHKIKNPSGKAANMIVSMRPLFRWRVIATGTAVTKAHRAHDIQMQWKFLNPERFKEWPTADDFKNEFGRWIEVSSERGSYSKWVAPRHIEELHRRIHMDSFAVHREDCFDLPPRENVVEKIKIRGETARVYKEMSQKYFAQLSSGEIAEASYAIVVSLRLAQITGGTVNTPEGQNVRIGVEKLNALRVHLLDALERSEKLVIAARFKADLNAIAQLCEEIDLPCWQLRGGMKRTQTDKNIREFRRHEDAGVFLMQPSAGSLGIDLSTSAKMIWFSLTTSYVDFTQACDRVALSRKSTTFIFLLAEGTIDEIMYEVLQQDGEVVKRITASPEKLLLSKQSHLR
jgi:Mesyanzhinovviridae DNA helicase